jgi:hypothetical protein
MNERIHARARQRLEASRDAGAPHIRRRLAQLDREWDFERTVELEAPTVILAGLLLGASLDRRWLAVPAFAASMLLVHNSRGWYPLLPLLRAMGVRTRSEIDTERRDLLTLLEDMTAESPLSGLHQVQP